MTALVHEEKVVRLRPVAGRLPPHDLDAEAAVLSAVLLSRDALDRVLSLVAPEHFYSDANGDIFRAALALAEVGAPVDVRTVAGWLRDRERLVSVGGAPYIAMVVDATPAVANVEAHARIVRDLWRLRQTIAECQRIAAEGYGNVGDIQEFLSNAAAGVERLATASEAKGARRIGAALRESFEKLVAAGEGDHGLFGAPTGLKDLDRVIGGLAPGGVTIVGARSSMGKTALALHMAAAAAQHSEKVDGVVRRCAAFVWSGEMRDHQLATREMFSAGGVDKSKMKSKASLDEDDWRLLTEGARYVEQLPVWVDDRTGITPMALRAEARRVKAECKRAGLKLAVVVVDYITLMNGRAGLPRGATKEEEIASITRALKILAGELDVHVIALSQLNRSVEDAKAKDRRPTMAHLKGSGAIEADADNVLLVYRDEYYNPESPDKGIAEIIVAKQRDGARGVTVRVSFMDWCIRFGNLEEQR